MKVRGRAVPRYDNHATKAPAAPMQHKADVEEQLPKAWLQPHIQGNAIPPRRAQVTAKAKFDETVEVSLVLGTDPRRGDHAVRGTATLPHGTGKPVRVAVFAEGADADAARAAGATAARPFSDAKNEMHQGNESAAALSSWCQSQSLLSPSMGEP